MRPVQNPRLSLSFLAPSQLRIGALFVVFCLSSAWGQGNEETETGDVIRLRDFIVTGEFLYSDQVNALKTPTPILDVPQSLSITTSDEIQKRGITSIRQIVDYTPGVNTSQGESHRDAVVFRGVRSTADFFIDGFRDDVQYYRPLYNVEQVEVLRGANALFFGRGGTGGVINRVTKKGLVGENFSGFELAIDSFGESIAQIDSNTAVSDRAALRVNAFYETLANHRDYYDGNRFGINPSLRLHAGDRTTFDFSYELADHERFIDRGIPTGADGRPIEAFKDLFFGDTDLNFTELEAHLLRATMQHRFADTLKGRLSLFYGDYDKAYANFYASNYNAVLTPDRVTLDGYIDATQRQNMIFSGDLVGEFQTGTMDHVIVAGIEFIQTDNDNDRFNSFFDQSMDDTETFLIGDQVMRNGVGINANGLTTTNVFTDPKNDDTAADVTTYSLYLRDEISISDHLNLILGGRFDSFEIEVLDRLTGVTRSRTDEEISPRLGVIYKPEQDVSFYASYSETFLPRSGEQFANITDESARLEPDTFTNLETGVKWDFSPSTSFTAAVFQVEKSSPETDKDDAAALRVVDSTITGFEAQLKGRVTDRWHITAGYSYLDGEVVSQDATDGNRPRELPEHMFSVWNSYQLTQRLGLGLGAVYQGDTFIDNGNQTILPSYLRLDAAGFYDLSDSIRLQVNLENLTDELYFPHAHASHQATVAAPFNARFAVIARF
jgi:catecholate siderophore receptor